MLIVSSKHVTMNVFFLFLEFTSQIERCGGKELWMRQFRAMFVKRVINTYRNWKIALSQIILPVIFAILAGFIYKAVPEGSDLDPRPMNFVELLEESKQYVVYTADTEPGFSRDVSFLKSFYTYSFITILKILI